MEFAVAPAQPRLSFQRWYATSSFAIPPDALLRDPVL
jgi:hypothetical protein